MRFLSLSGTKTPQFVPNMHYQLSGNNNALICARYTLPGRQRTCFVLIKCPSCVAANVLIAATMAMGITDQNTVGRPLLHSIVASAQCMCRSGDKRTWAMLLRFHFCTKSWLQRNVCAEVATTFSAVEAQKWQIKTSEKHKFFRIFASDMRKRVSSCICLPRPKLWHYYRDQRYFINT